MTAMYATSAEVQQDLTDLCSTVGITIENTAPALLYGTATEPRVALSQLRDALAATIYRERSVRTGDEESYLTVLDAIERTTTIKIRRNLT
ncbi:hypothetical protein [Nocardia sp. NPDC060249]|uniref:hypothetical protein n=1 Tax=Nocardia sp. NPDC060249 TaxID=3347082 RepID=UPI003662E928